MMLKLQESNWVCDRERFAAGCIRRRLGYCPKMHSGWLTLSGTFWECYWGFHHLGIASQSLSFSHVHRKGNAVADKLAKLTKYLDVPKVWLEDIPSDVNSLVVIDSSFAEVWIKFLDGFLHPKKKKNFADFIKQGQTHVKHYLKTFIFPYPSWLIWFKCHLQVVGLQI